MKTGGLKFASALNIQQGGLLCKIIKDNLQSDFKTWTEPSEEGSASLSSGRTDG